MISIAFVFLIIFTSYYFTNFYKNNTSILYIISGIISFISIILSKLPITLPFIGGFLGFSFFYVVMIIGILKKESTIYIRIYSIRNILSILGFILLSPHAIYYLIEKIFNNGTIELFGVIAYIIMIPLFFTSFKTIKNDFMFLKWKRIQKYAYFVYLLIFIHLVTISDLPNLILYLVLFIPYLVIKPYRFIKIDKPLMKAKQANLKKQS